MKLIDKVAIVTGAASGIGRATAILYAKEGAKVIVSDINLEAAKETVKMIEDNKGSAIAVMTDMSKAEDVKKLVESTIEKYGTLDILVNNAGIMDNFIPLGEITDELWEKVCTVNTTGSMRLMRESLKIFLEKNKGIIINIASLGGLYGSRAGAAYTASKYAIVGLTKNVGFQYASNGIRCNAIAPGSVETNIGATITAPSEFGMSKAMSGINLSPRAGKPEEIASVALFLASDESSFVNGEVIVADGGWSAY
ncbi:MAG: SDR family oxidoreductase [Actinomycetota bacterium]|nr:SDR family oxidoreductase [Actinomycetota bacterium]